jgi:hypothetical protein
MARLGPATRLREQIKMARSTAYRSHRDRTRRRASGDSFRARDSRADPARLSREGVSGHVTGIGLLSDELIGKRLSLLLEVVPDAKKIAYLSGGPGSPIYKDLRDRTVDAGRALGREILVLDVRNTRELEAAFIAVAKQGAGAVIVGNYTSLVPVQCPGRRPPREQPKRSC